MRFFMPARIAPFALAAALAATPGNGLRAETPPAEQPALEAAAPYSPRPARTDAALDELFERLASAVDEREARGVSLLINRRWMRSGSDTADLLMTRAQQALRERDPALAVELLDRVVALQPDWAEAWNRRAAAFQRLGDPIAAIADIHRAVTLEPRHFGAWAGLGNLLQESGDKFGALASYQRALAINPQLPRIGPIVDKLRREIEGVSL